MEVSTAMIHRTNKEVSRINKFIYTKMNFLKGKLTYLLAVSAVSWGVTGYLMGWTDVDTAMKVIWVGLDAFGLRRAVN
mgnify:CR=1 FL=1